MKNIIIFSLILMSLKSIGQTTYSVNIILNKDSLEQGEYGFATYEVFGDNSSLTFSWQYEGIEQLSNDQFGIGTNQISFTDTLFYSFSDVGLHEIRLRVHDENDQIIETITEVIYVRGVESLPCLNAPSSCELVCNGNFESTEPDDPNTTIIDFVDGPNQLNEASGFDDFNPQFFPSCNTDCEQNSYYVVYNSPDYFSGNNAWVSGSHICNPGENPINVPNNFAGDQESHLAGNSYAGFIAYIDDPINYFFNFSAPNGLSTREYVQGYLSTPMVAQTYYVSFWISLADNSNFAIENIGIKFINFNLSGNVFPNSETTNFKYNYANLISEPCVNCPLPEITQEIVYDSNLPVIPDVQNISGIISDKQNWVQVYGTFTASGDENFFLIGNFSNDANTNSQPVSDGLPCAGNQAYYYVDDISVSTVPTSVSITATPNPVCEGQSVTLTASPAISNAQYNWYDSNGTLLNPLAPPGQFNFSVSPSSTTTYSVKLFTSCDDPTATITVNVEPLPIVNAGPDQTICPDQFTTLSATGNAVQYSWYIGNALISTNQNQSINPVTLPTTYTVIGTSANGCTASDDITIYPFEIIPIEVSAPLNSCCSNPTISVNPDYVNYNWDISPPILFTGQGTNSINAVLDPDNSYQLTIEVTDANGCTQNETFFIEDCCAYNPDFVYQTDPCFTSKLSDYLPGGVSAWPSNPNITSTSMTGMAIRVNNDLIIDVDYSLLQNTIFSIYPGRKLILDPNITFNVEASVLRERCKEMWDGVYVEEQSSTLNLNDSRMRQAINAVVASNGGVINLYRSQFLENHIGVIIKDYSSGVYPASITACEFSSTSSLLPPYYNQQTHMGIQIDGAGIVNIGLAGSTNTNYFNNMDYGIHVSRTSANILNNDFRNVRQSSTNPSCSTCWCELGTAVCAINIKSFTNHFIKVGGTNLNEINVFDNNKFGTEVHGRFKTDILMNDFNNHREAIGVHNASGQLINIKDNIIKNFGIGIGIYEIPKSNLTIQNNRLNNGLPFSPSVSNTGIYVNHAFQTFFNADISGNDIRRVRNGIYLIKASGFALFNPLAQIQIHDNSINFNQLSTNSTFGVFHTGIKMENCLFAGIRDNDILKPGMTTTNFSVAAQIEGIRIDLSPVMIVENNYTKNLGFGINVKNNCNPSALKCNELQRSYNGINFVNAAIGSQLNSGQPTGNEWTGPGSLHSVNFDLAGNITTPINWYYNSSNGGDFVPTSNINASLISGAPLNVAIADQCGNPAMLTPPQEREHRIGKIVRNENSFTVNSNEHRYNEMLYAYTEIEKNAGWLNLNTVDDSTYQNFYNNYQNNSIGSFTKTYISNEDGNYVTAKNYNSSVMVNSDWEYYQKRVNEIYLNSKVDSIPISSTDSVELYDIAYLHSAYYGPGVFSARAILKLEVEDLDNGTTRMVDFMNDSGMISEMEFVVFPNPSNGKFIFSTNYEKTISEISIFDITGQLVYFSNNSFDSTREFELDLENGVYLFQVKDINELVQTVKLIISN